MGIGINSFLMAVGAILTFAVDATVAGLDIKVVGVILMIAGAVGLILTLVVFAPRRRLAVTETNTTRAVVPGVTSSRVTTRKFGLRAWNRQAPPSSLTSHPGLIHSAASSTNEKVVGWRRTSIRRPPSASAIDLASERPMP